MWNICAKDILFINCIYAMNDWIGTFYIAYLFSWGGGYIQILYTNTLHLFSYYDDIFD